MNSNLLGKGLVAKVGIRRAQVHHARSHPVCAQVQAKRTKLVLQRFDRLRHSDVTRLAHGV
eukprot:252670-Pyramimonas_sp.AAC.1